MTIATTRDIPLGVGKFVPHDEPRVSPAVFGATTYPTTEAGYDGLSLS